MISTPELQAFVRERQHAAIRVHDDTPLPKISVVTPSYNQGKFLEAALLSILNQQYPRLELIVMDGGSTDQSVDIIRKYEDELAYWQSAPDGGQAEAIRRGFEKSTGDVFAFLNSDDMYLPGTLKKVAAFFLNNPAAEFMYGDCLIVSERLRPIRYVRPIEFDRDVFLYENSIITQPASFWTRGAYEKVGGIDARWQFCLDYDFFCRLLTANVKFWRHRDVLAAFRLHDQSKTFHLQHVNRAEYRAISESVVGPRRFADSYIRVPCLRVKRWLRQPAALREAARAQVWRMKAGWGQ